MVIANFVHVHTGIQTVTSPTVNDSFLAYTHGTWTHGTIVSFSGCVAWDGNKQLLIYIHIHVPVSNTQGLNVSIRIPTEQLHVKALEFHIRIPT